MKLQVFFGYFHCLAKKLFSPNSINYSGFLNDTGLYIHWEQCMFMQASSIYHLLNQKEKGNDLFFPLLSNILWATNKYFVLSITLNQSWSIKPQ